MKDASTHELELLDGRWLKRRFDILMRDNWKCAECGQEEEVCHVHHKHYLTGKALWEYHDDDLVTLCGCCHRKRHDIGYVEDAIFLPVEAQSWHRRKVQGRKVKFLRDLEKLKAVG